MAKTENVKRLIEKKKAAKSAAVKVPAVAEASFREAEAMMAAAEAPPAATPAPAKEPTAMPSNEEMVAYAVATPGIKAVDLIRKYRVSLNHAKALIIKAAQQAVTPATAAAAETFLDGQAATPIAGLDEMVKEEAAEVASERKGPIVECEVAKEDVPGHDGNKPHVFDPGVCVGAVETGEPRPPLTDRDRRFHVPEASTPAPAPDREVFVLAIASIHEHPANPRILYPRIPELATDIKEHGLREPIKVRQVGDQYEVLSGHRRLRAMKSLGWTETLATVEHLDDLAAYQRVVVENEHREDLTAIEEGLAFQGLVSRGQTTEQIAALVGKSVAHVYARMKLTALGEDGRHAMVAGWLSAETGLLVARIPTEGLQTAALKEIGPDDRQGRDAMSYREAQHHIQSRYMLVLAKAPFDRKSADLLPIAGACTECPKRSGALPVEIRTDLKGADICLDRDCYGQKTQADWKLRAAAAAEAKIETIDAAAAAKRHLVYTGDQVAEHDGLVTLDSTCHDEGGDYKEWKKVLPKKAVPPPDVLIQSPHTGAAIPAWKRETLRAAAVEAKVLKPSTTKGGSAEDAKHAAERKKIREDRKVAHAAIDSVMEASGLLRRAPVEVWRELAEQALEHGWALRIAKRREMEDTQALYAAIKKMEVAEIQDLLVEAMLQREVETMLAPYGQRKTGTFKKMIEAFGTDWETAKAVAAGEEEGDGEEEAEEKKPKKSAAKGPLARKQRASK